MLSKKYQPGQAVEQVVGVLDVSELGQPRATQRYEKRQRYDEQTLRERIVSLASQYGRYGYRQGDGPAAQ